MTRSKGVRPLLSKAATGLVVVRRLPAQRFLMFAFFATRGVTSITGAIVGAVRGVVTSPATSVEVSADENDRDGTIARFRRVRRFLSKRWGTTTSHCSRPLSTITAQLIMKSEGE